MEELEFDYYTVSEVEKISFIQMPKILFSSPIFKKLSTDSKVLYSFMQDRFRLSKKNNWVDDKGRVYIYFTLEEIKEVFNIGNDKVSKLMKELEAYDLICRKRQGLGKPTIIYVKNCHSIKKSAEKPCEIKTSEKPKSGVPKNRNQDFGKSETNNTNINNNNINNKLYNQSINHNNINNIISKNEYFLSDNDKRIDMIDYDIKIKNNIELDVEYLGEEKYNEVYPIYKLMCDVMRLNPSGTTNVNGDNISIGIIQKRFLNDIRLEHIQYVIECIKNTGKILNIRKYLIVSLYNSVGTIDAYYSNKVYSDFINSDKNDDNVLSYDFI